MKKIINSVLCVAFAVAAFAMFVPLFEGHGKFWHGLLCVLFICASIVASGRIDEDIHRKIS